MSETPVSTGDHCQPRLYEIRIKGHLAAKWIEWFGDVTIAQESNGDTLIIAPAVDQAALHGLLRKVRDLGMPLRSVICIEPEQADS